MKIDATTLARDTIAVYDMPWRRERHHIHLETDGIRYTLHLGSNLFVKLKTADSAPIELRLERIVGEPVELTGDLEKLGRVWWEQVEQIDSFEVQP